MKKSLLTAAAAISIVVMSIDLAHAESPPPSSPMGVEHKHMWKWHHGFGAILPLEGLKLTDAQKAKIKEIFKSAHTKDFRERLGQMHALHKQLRAILTAPGPVDQAKLKEVEQKINDLRVECDNRRIQTEVRIHDVLTKDQLEEIAHRSDVLPPPLPKANH